MGYREENNVTRKHHIRLHNAFKYRKRIDSRSKDFYIGMISSKTTR